MQAEYILGIESSCDDTSLALVSEKGSVLAQETFSQNLIHQKFGGVVPEVASRSHIDQLEPLLKQLLNSAKISPQQIRAVAATCTPGLIGPLLVGSTFGAGLARGWNIPFIGIHHLRAHVASIFLNSQTINSIKEESIKFENSIAILVSGGHTLVLQILAGLKLKILASSSDDAAGECFDKSAKAMGLDYPGGPVIEALATKLSHEKTPLAKKISQDLPRPRSEAGFSFAGLKTAIRLYLEKNPSLSATAEMAWAIQDAISDTLIQSIENSLRKHKIRPENLFFCGGVSANKTIRKKLSEFCKKEMLELRVPPIEFSTDNGAMVAACAWIQDPELSEKTVSARKALE